MTLSYKTEQADDFGVIVVSSDLDNEPSGEAFCSAFDNLRKQGIKRIVLDLSGVQIINSYGIGKILMCHKKIKSDEGELLVKPLKGFVKETFELLMLDTLFPVYEGQEPSGAES